MGWDISVIRSHGSDQGILASWQAGLTGTNWICELVAKGQAKDLGGNGYPWAFEMKAGVLVPILLSGPPEARGPSVFFGGGIQIDIERLQTLPADEPLRIEAWDQS